MSGRSRNFVFAYAFLVALPLIGLAGVLKTGRGLTAPRAIDGLWAFQIDAGAQTGCSGFFASIPDKVISISQSGKSFLLSIPGEPRIAATGTLEGNAIRATVTSRESLQSCSGPAQLRLVANVEKEADSSVISGQLSDATCSSCASAVFKATRKEDAPRKGGR